MRARTILATAALLAATPLSVASAATASGIRKVDFRNGFTYEGGYGPIIVRGGEYSNSSEDAKEFFSVRDVDYGDLDGDGAEEAIVTTTNNTGGTGNFSDGLIYTMRAGRVRLVTSVGVGDRADGGIHDITISKGRIVVDRFGGDGGACCPEYVERTTLLLQKGRLSLTGRSSKRAYVNLDASDPGEVVEIKFLPGGTSATVVGLADGQLHGHFFEARAGQTARITVPPAPPGTRFTVSVRQGGGLVGSVSSGGTLTRKLTESGNYSVVLSASPPPADDAVADYATFDLEIR